MLGKYISLAPTYSGEGLYYSTDFGETATFVDGSMNFISIAADKTKGGVYCVTLPEALYYSDEYGYSNTWEFKSSELSSDLILSGIIEGHVFSSCYKHSENFGANFITHSLNGWFGSGKYSVIDNIDENIGYVLTYKLTQSDSLYLLRTIDTFENVVVVQQWNYHWNDNIKLSFGSLTGELFLINFTQNNFWVSNNYGDDFIRIDTFNITDYFHVGMVGGQQPGEVYILYSFINWMWYNAHIYIYHSIDYGKTFEVFHPFSKGNEPVLANFSTDTTEGEMPFTVDFSNFSIGDILQYEWDFDNDGNIDSYEQSPTFTYADTGYYSVRLTITGPDSANTFLKESYIHVQKATGFNENIASDINFYPNPFSNYITFEFSHIKQPGKLIIYNIDGRRINTFNKPSGISNVVWDGTDKNGFKCKAGIYYAVMENKTYSQKIVLID